MQSLYKIENFKPEIKPMIENLQDEPYQLENKQAKVAKFRVNTRWELEGEKYPKIILKVLERQNPHNQTISQLHTDDNISKYSRNPKGLFKSAKKFYETLKTNFQSCYH